MANMLPWALAQAGKTFWMPEQASSVADDVDFSFYLVLWICTFFAVGITVAVVFFVIKYRARADGKELEGKTAGHSTALELTWTIIPTVIVLVIFYDGFRAYLNMSVPPTDVYEIQVNARTWEWSFVYPNGHIQFTELHIPKDTPVQLVLNSADVIHAFFVPQFRVKKDAVPRRYNKVWFEATRVGTFDIYCTEYCGRDHSQMLGTVVVHEKDDFEQWLKAASVITGTPLEIGQKVYNRCKSCHNLDATVPQGGGPGWKNLFGYPRQLSDGRVVTADEQYIRDSILYPQKDIVAGFGSGMPSFQGSLRDPQDIDGVIALMKSLSDRAPKEQSATQPATRPNQ